MRKADVDAKIEEYGLRRINRLDRRTAAEEVLAEMAQNTPQWLCAPCCGGHSHFQLRTHVPGFKSLALTDAELIRNHILPAGAPGWSVVAPLAPARAASFSRDRVKHQTDLESSKSCRAHRWRS